MAGVEGGHGVEI